VLYQVGVSFVLPHTSSPDSEMVNGAAQKSVQHCDVFILPIGFRECIKTLVEENKIYPQYRTEMPYGCAAI